MSSLPPFHDRDGFIWLNGELVAWREAKIHVLTHALHYASCVFEGERSYDGVVFKGKEHTARLFRSAQLLGFEIPYAAKAIEDAKAELMRRNSMENCYVRAFAWRGSEMMGVSAQNNRINVAVATWLWGDYFKDKMKGIRMTRAKWRRPSPKTAPSEAKAAGLYMICTLSKHAAENAGYSDALMLDYRGRVAEATGANIFFVQDGALHTPTPDCFLNGITRQTVIALAKARKIDVVERAIKPSELKNFSECFLTGTAAEITPVAEIGPVRYKPSKLTETLLHDFQAATRRKKAA